MLERGELTRRLKALRELRGYRQHDLEAELATAGLQKTDFGKLERGDPDKPLTRAMLAQLVDILRAPEAYFTEPDLDKVLFRTPLQPATDDDLAGLDAAGRHLEEGSQTFADETPGESQEEPGSEGGSAQ